MTASEDREGIARIATEMKHDITVIHPTNASIVPSWVTKVLPRNE